MEIIKSVVNDNHTTKPVLNEVKVNVKVVTDSKSIAETINE